MCWRAAAARPVGHLMVCHGRVSPQGVADGVRRGVIMARAVGRMGRHGKEDITVRTHLDPWQAPETAEKQRDSAVFGRRPSCQAPTPRRFCRQAWPKDIFSMELRSIVAVYTGSPALGSRAPGARRCLPGRLRPARRRHPPPGEQMVPRRAASPPGPRSSPSCCRTARPRH